MRAVYVKAPFEFEVREVELPKLKEHEVLVDIRACAVCGTDMHIADHEAEEWQTFGHEVAGVVAEVGEFVTTCKPGDHIVVESSSFCHTCENCRNGEVERCTSRFSLSDDLDYKGFGDYMIIPQEAAVRYEGLDFRDACIAEPLGVALDLFYTADVRLNEDVAVIGLGPIGLMAIALAKMAGARNIYAIQRSGRSKARIALAKKLGAQVILTSETDLSSYPFPRGGVDKVLDTASPSTLVQAFEIANFGGVVAFLGIDFGPGGTVTFDANYFHLKKLQLRSSFAAPALWFPRALDLIRSKKIDTNDFITQTFPLEELEKMMKKQRDDSSDVIKMVMVKPE
ncbi:MAG: alcohol dehydrogenase catalytic domain-containing protein [Lachnospiraceae bacterium]|nr:alcohol dehydrogenase catalytic domain-containing protein [Lachnospiraceae bacterium]MDD7024770.1 alcohol dehydrogenase catalytic domain-containing protein [Oscillospiraceae bacterium]MDY5541829.1 alcohol dehydrogenase catalytic domain-containing protein [Lachnospiraceae bacterium]MDY5649116.1 alcohol dehydrogenase catalytic domain-containing protein [Lachnospiraceae bacterium]